MLETRKTELEAQIKGATVDQGADEDSEEAERGADEPAADEIQLKEWKKEVGALRKEIKSKEQGFAQRLNAAVDGLDAAGAAALLLTVLRNDMEAILEHHISAQRQQVVAAFENWWDKYRVTLNALESTRAEADVRFEAFLRELRYA